MGIVHSLVASAKASLIRTSEKSVVLGGRKYRMNRFFDAPLDIRAAHEPWSYNALKAALSVKEGLFIDVGANTGQTLRRLLSIDSERHYLGFEPQSDCIFYLKKFIEKNKLTHCHVLPVGLSNKIGALTLYLRHTEVDPTASTIPGFRPAEFYSRSEIIYVTKGDSVLEGLGHSPPLLG